MDTSTITALLETANMYLNQLKEVQNTYITKINDNLTEIETLVNNSEDHSQEFIDMKIEHITKRNEQLLDGFNEKIKDTTSGIQSWYDTTVNSTKLTLAELQQSELGIELPEDALKSAAEAIPHPALPIPEFKIELPKIEIDPNTKLSIPRIPTI